MSDKPDPILQQKEQQQLKTQLLWRLGIAGTLIAGVLGAIAWFDQDKKNAQPDVQIPQIAPIASIASAIIPAEPASAVASAPEVATTPTINPTPSPAATTAPNQTQSEPISNIPKRTAEISPSKSTIPTALPKPTLPLAPATQPSLPAPNFPVASSSHLGFSVQAGVFLHSSNAEKLLAQIQAAGIPAYLETRVQIGPFKTKAEADAAVKKLRKLGVEPIIKTE
jgi:DedD protein